MVNRLLIAINILMLASAAVILTSSSSFPIGTVQRELDNRDTSIFLFFTALTFVGSFLWWIVQAHRENAKLQLAKSAKVRLRPPTRCGVCGYDLRFSPYRCPECGTVTEYAKTRPVSIGRIPPRPRLD